MILSLLTIVICSTIYAVHTMLCKVNTAYASPAYFGVYCAILCSCYGSSTTRDVLPLSPWSCGQVLHLERRSPLKSIESDINSIVLLGSSALKNMGGEVTAITYQGVSCLDCPVGCASWVSSPPTTSSVALLQHSRCVLASTLTTHDPSCCTPGVEVPRATRSRS